MADVATRYFCHQCNVNIDHVTEDFCCPTCNLGFIEERTNSPENEEEDNVGEGGPHLHHHMDFPGPLAALLPNFFGPMGLDLPQGERVGRPERFHIHRQGPLRPMPRGAPGTSAAPNPDRHLENFLQDLISNVTGVGGIQAAGPGGISFRVLPGSHRIEIAGEPGIQIHGNPGDYAWGRGGLDAIITQLLNQMDGAGPPPMAQENIKDIVSVNVTPSILEKNPNCSVCLEDFKLEESVKQLECKHCFHQDCIVPWLEIHGTCPVCRKVLSEDAEPGEEQDQDAENESADSEDSNSEGATGGIAGSIQNFISSLLGVGAVSSRPSQTAATSRSTAPSTSGSTTTTAGSRPAETSASDDETPASRRQRLDSDFVDFDLE